MDEHRVYLHAGWDVFFHLSEHIVDEIGKRLRRMIFPHEENTAQFRAALRIARCFSARTA